MSPSRLFCRRTAVLSGAVCCAVGLWAVVLGGCSRILLHESRQLLMGTYATVVSPDPRCAAIVFGEFRRLERLLSKYDPNSDISRLNASGAARLDRETFRLLQRCALLARATGWAFDVTVGPLVDLWGFSAKRFVVPSSVQIAHVRERIGSDKLVFDEESATVRFAVAGMKVDLGGVAKGYALDVALRKVKEQGIRDCLISLGGQVAAIGKKGGLPWTVGVRSACGPRRVVKEFALRDASVSTSGDAEQFFLHEGRRYSHLIDPRTGYPVQRACFSVTVSAAEAVLADALSTALAVLERPAWDRILGVFPGAELIFEEGNDVGDTRKKTTR